MKPGDLIMTDFRRVPGGDVVLYSNPTGPSKRIGTARANQVGLVVACCVEPKTGIDYVLVLFKTGLGWTHARFFELAC